MEFLLFLPVRLCRGEILSKIHDRASKLIIPHHSVQRGYEAARAGRVHPVRVHELDPGQTDRLHGPVDLLD